MYPEYVTEYMYILTYKGEEHPWPETFFNKAFSRRVPGVRPPLASGSGRDSRMIPDLERLCLLSLIAPLSLSLSRSSVRLCWELEEP